MDEYNTDIDLARFQKIEMPGPKGWPYLGSLPELGLDPIRFLTKLSDNYGESVRFKLVNRPAILLTNPRDINTVYTQESQAFVQRDDFLYDPMHRVFGDGLVNSRYDVWSKQRALLQPYFTKQATRQWIKIIQLETDAVIKAWWNPSQNNRSINISFEMKRLVQRILSKILFGQRLKYPDVDEAINAIDIIGRHLPIQIIFSLILKRRYDALPLPGAIRYRVAIKLLRRILGDLIDIKTRNPGDDLISKLIKLTHDQPRSAMSKSQLKDELITLFFAGNDTTAVTLSWVLYFLAHDHDVAQRTVREIRSHDLIPEKNGVFEKYTYLCAVINETLRLRPPAHTIIRVAKVNFAINRFHVDKDTMIFLSPYITQRRSDLWERPNVFYPEHFSKLKKTGMQRPKFSYFPFGGGLHSCLGRHLAFFEIMTIAHKIFNAFSPQPVNKVSVKARATLHPSEDIYLTLTKNPSTREG